MKKLYIEYTAVVGGDSWTETFETLQEALDLLQHDWNNLVSEGKTDRLAGVYEVTLKGSEVEDYLTGYLETPEDELTTREVVGRSHNSSDWFVNMGGKYADYGELEDALEALKEGAK